MACVHMWYEDSSSWYEAAFTKTDSRLPRPWSRHEHPSRLGNKAWMKWCCFGHVWSENAGRPAPIRDYLVRSRMAVAVRRLFQTFGTEGRVGRLGRDCGIFASLRTRTKCREGTGNEDDGSGAYSDGRVVPNERGEERLGRVAMEKASPR
ncbi:hypothetical protein BC567DRAFT_65752 [Phyllosticta citribraziliensis]